MKKDRAAPELVLAVGLLALAVAVRWIGWGLVARDVTRYLVPWSEFVRANGGFSALRFNFADYNVPYLYAFVGLTWLDEHTPVALLTGVKLLSALFDGVLAIYVYKLVALRRPGWRMPLLAALTALLLPTVVMDGSYWGQCDSIYTAFSVAGLYYLFKDRPWIGCLLLGVAFSFKLQAIFVFPVLLVLLLAGRLPWRCLLAIPAVFAGLAVPAWLAGRPFGELMVIYVSQSARYTKMTLNAPTLYAFVRPSVELDTVRSAGVLFAGAAFLLLVFVILARRLTLDTERLVVLATSCAIMAPFLLPAMHERYFFQADVLTLVAAFWVPRRLWFVPALMQFTSFVTYQTYLFIIEEPAVDLRILSLLVFAAWVATTAEVLRRRPAPVTPVVEEPSLEGAPKELVPV
jgi:Gpi18-like mannosyltransferase